MKCIDYDDFCEEMDALEQWDSTIDYHLVREVLDKADKIDVPTVQTGHWKWVGGNKYTCSICSRTTECDEVMGDTAYEYCPYCGVKLEGSVKYEL